MAEEKQVQGWRDVQITPDMPLSAIVHFANILNQRLVTVEDLIKVNDKTLTQIYAEQAEQERAEMEKKMAEQAKKEEK
jgi:hypothetical protein